MSSTKPGMVEADFVWVAGQAALDFLNTRYQLKGEPVETLTSAEALRRWLALSGLLEPHEMPALRRLPLGQAHVQRVVEEAQHLREWFRSVVETRVREPAEPGRGVSLRRLNDLLAQGDTYSRVLPEPLADDGSPGKGWRLARLRRWGEASELLQPIAEAMAELICEGDFRLVRQCEAPDCALLFLDRTKSHRRRWCDMALCGNRMKAAAFRARR